MNCHRIPLLLKKCEINVALHNALTLSLCAHQLLISFIPYFQTKQVDNVRMIDRYNVKNPTIGTLYITATHIIFVDPETNKETWVS